MGAVYRGTDRRDGTTVAIKLLHVHLVGDETFRERFEREAHVAALLRSPYTVKVLDFGVEHGSYFIAMEYVDGRSLRDRIRDEGPLPAAEAMRIGVRVARALEEAEARGVVHRDIKPDNVMLASDGSVKVADFGIARQMGSGAVTMPGAFVGTLVYAAPEIARGEVDHRSDIYSLGATLYHALTGRPPFEGPPLDVLRKHADEPVPREPLAGQHEAVIAVVLRCLEKDPNERYQSASALAAALENAAQAAAASPPVVETTVVAAPPPVEVTQVMRTPAEAAKAAEPAREPAEAPPRVPAPPAPARSGSRIPMSLVMGIGGAAAAAVVAAIALLVFAGGGGDDGPSTLSDDDFARMMLTQEDLSPAFSDFSEDGRLSGPIANDDLIAGACDATAVGTQVEQDGRLAGYESVYRSSQVSSRAIEIRSRVDQYETADGASGALTEYADTQLNGTGELACSGVTVAEATEFEVTEIGDEARGVQTTRGAVSSDPQTSRAASVQGAEVVTTAVAFAMGDLVGRVEIDGDPAGDYRGLTRDLAEKLEARMTAVLEEGDGETSTPRPSRDPDDSGTPAASGSPGASGSPVGTPTPTPAGGATPAGQTAAPTQKPVTAAPTAPPAQQTAPPTAAPPNAPAINSLGCPAAGNVGDPVTCSPSISGNVTSRSWSAPGGSPASGSGANFSTTYSSTGSKTITLQACNGSACGSKQATVAVAAIISTGYTVLIDSVSAGRNALVTVGVYVEVPDSGLGYWDIDVQYDTSRLTIDSCSAFEGDCDPFFDFDVCNFFGEPFQAPVGFVQLGTITFETGSTPGFAYLDIIVYGIEDAFLNDVYDETFVVSGGINIQ
jgi:hypothetical protein